MLYSDALKIHSCGKHCEKREIACNKQFLLFSQCFLLYMALIFHFNCTLKCCLQYVSIWNSLKILSSGNGLRVKVIHEGDVSIPHFVHLPA